MNILIDQAGFGNKGAELMFCSVVEVIKKRYPDAKIFAHKTDVLGSGKEFCTENGINYAVSGLRARIIYYLCKLALRLKLVRPKLERNFTLNSKIDIIIDAGGFRFGDQWRHRASTARRMRRYYNSFRKNCKMIFLPQSFGPFNDKYSIKTAKIALKHVSLVYARETSSLDYLKQIAPEKLKIDFKRDFTILHKFDSMPYALTKGDYIVFVINSKMITHLGKQEVDYVGYISELIKDLIAKGEKVVLLNHAGAGDKKICVDVQQRTGLDVPIISNIRAMQIKNVIGGAKLLVSSRYHGVVSGIVQRVPTFCTSWSHKYNELLSSFEISDNLLELTDIDAAKQKLSDALTNPQKYITKPEILEREKSATEDMWKDIFAFIERS